MITPISYNPETKHEITQDPEFSVIVPVKLHTITTAPAEKINL